MISKRQSSIAFALIALPLAACQDRQTGAGFDRLERLVFVPAAPCVLLPETRMRVDCSNPRPFLVDRFEVTRGEWSAWLEDQAAGSPGYLALEFWEGEGPRYPATGMDLAEAKSFAAAGGMRVPTSAEWLRFAVGTRAQFFPWKPVPHASVANTDELGLGQLTTVGTFEAGRTPAGVYDVSGNAMEWVVTREVQSLPDLGDDKTWAMGGSYLSHKRATYRFNPAVQGNVSYNALLLAPGSRSNDVGLRLVADAESWLRERSPLWASDEVAILRLKRVGRSWGSVAVPLLSRLAQEPGAPAALKALLSGAAGEEDRS